MTEVSKYVSMSDSERELYVNGLQAKGYTYAQIAQDLGTTKGNISKWLSKWKKKSNFPEGKKVSENDGNFGNFGNSKPSKKNTTKKKKTTSPSKKPPTKTPGDDDDQDGITDQEEEINFEIPTQLKEMVKCSEYVCDHIEKASFGDAIKFYEKTKMLENEDKDFAEDNAFLGEVEALLFQYKIIEEQSPCLDVRVENPDLIEEGI